MTDAIEEIRNANSQRSGFFGLVLDSLAALFCCGSRSSATSASQPVLEINIGEEFARNLTKTFGDPKLVIPQGFQPTVEIPVALGQQVYAAYLESIFRQQEAHNQLLAQLAREDDDFAKQLPQEAGENAAVVPPPRKEQEEGDGVSAATPISAEQQRKKAQAHLKERHRLFDLAKKYKRANNNRLAARYFEEAKRQLRLSEEANNLAATTFLDENSRRHPGKNTIDLHGLFVKEAIQALDIFLDGEISNLRGEFLSTTSLMVVTGRGKHSANGIPKIKPAVMERLRVRRLKYSEVNPGLLRVVVADSSRITNELNNHFVLEIE